MNLSIAGKFSTPVQPHDWYNEDIVISEKGDTVPGKICKGCNITSLAEKSLDIV